MSIGFAVQPRVNSISIVKVTIGQTYMLITTIPRASSPLASAPGNDPYKCLHFFKYLALCVAFQDGKWDPELSEKKKKKSSQGPPVSCCSVELWHALIVCP